MQGVLMNIGQLYDKVLSFGPLIGLIGGISAIWVFIVAHLLDFEPIIEVSNSIDLFIEHKSSPGPARVELRALRCSLQLANTGERIKTIANLAVRITRTNTIDAWRSVDFFASKICLPVATNDLTVNDSAKFTPLTVPPKQERIVEVHFGDIMGRSAYEIYEDGLYAIEFFYKSKKKWKQYAVKNINIPKTSPRDTILAVTFVEIYGDAKELSRVPVTGPGVFTSISERILSELVNIFRVYLWCKPRYFLTSVVALARFAVNVFGLRLCGYVAERIFFPKKLVSLISTRSRITESTLNTTAQFAQETLSEVQRLSNKYNLDIVSKTGCFTKNNFRVVMNPSSTIISQYGDLHNLHGVISTITPQVIAGVTIWKEAPGFYTAPIIFAQKIVDIVLLQSQYSLYRDHL